MTPQVETDASETPLPLAFFISKYGISRTTAWRYRRAGLPAIQVGSKIFIRESQFIAFLEKMNGATVSAKAAQTN